MREEKNIGKNTKHTSWSPNNLGSRGTQGLFPVRAVEECGTIGSKLTHTTTTPQIKRVN